MVGWKPGSARRQSSAAMRSDGSATKSGGFVRRRSKRSRGCAPNSSGSSGEPSHQIGSEVIRIGPPALTTAGAARA